MSEDNVLDFNTAKAPKRHRTTGSNEPPEGDDLERRVEALEKKFDLILDKLSNIEINVAVSNEKFNSLETKIDTLKDISTTKTDLEKMKNTLLIWLCGVLVTCGATLLRLFFS